MGMDILPSTYMSECQSCPKPSRISPPRAVAGEYLSSSRDHKAVGRRPFDKMATLLAYLGPPEHKPLDSQ